MDAHSIATLVDVHPGVVRRVYVAARVLESANVYFRVALGFRTYEEQNAIFFQCHDKYGVRDHRPWKTNARGGFSPHNMGMAIDCYPFLDGSTGALEMNNPENPKFIAMVRALKDTGLAWGGDWVHAPKDHPHFQLAGVPTTPTDADRAAFARGGLHAVWARYPGVE